MKSAQLCLSLMLMSGCTTTEYVTEYRDRKVIPPNVLLVKCHQPFNEPPKTYGEAVERDPIWLSSWQTCAEQILELREFYGYSNSVPESN